MLTKERRLVKRYGHWRSGSNQVWRQGRWQKLQVLGLDQGKVRDVTGQLGDKLPHPKQDNPGKTWWNLFDKNPTMLYQP